MQPAFFPYFVSCKSANCWHTAGRPVPSVAVTSLGPEYDDIYVNQLPLSYNGQPVYIGNCAGIPLTPHRRHSVSIPANDE